MPRRAVRRRDAAPGPAAAPPGQGRQRRAAARGHGERAGRAAPRSAHVRRRGEEGDAGRRQHLHEQGGDARAIRCSTIRLLRRYFPELAERAPTRRATSLGSGVIVAPGGLRPHQPPRGRRRRRHRARALRRPRDAGARARHRSGIRSRGAEGRRREPADDHVRHRRRRCRSATSCWRSAIRSASATR